MASPRSARRKKIEPLDYTVAAMAPALKGMTSFLDVPADVVRASNALNLARAGHYQAPAAEQPPEAFLTTESQVSPGVELPPGNETSPEGRAVLGNVAAVLEDSPVGDVPEFLQDGVKIREEIGELEPPAQGGGNATSQRDILPEEDKNVEAEVAVGIKTTPEAVRYLRGKSTPGDETSSGVDGYLEQSELAQGGRAELPNFPGGLAGQVEGLSFAQKEQEPLPTVVSGGRVKDRAVRFEEVKPENYLHAAAKNTPEAIAIPGSAKQPEATKRPDVIKRPGKVITLREQVTPGVETYPEVVLGAEVLLSMRTVASVPLSTHLIPGVGRSKIRKCVLAQDGHSLGEEAIYQILWRSGKPETADLNGSRLISIGAAEIGMRANMAKKNVRQNISRLYEKLAIEIIEDFETVSSKPRKYRVYSYKQILERRRAAGLEYVLRNKGVLFCTESGVEIKSTSANQKTSGDETLPKPALSKRQRHLQQVAVHRAMAGHMQNTEIPAGDLLQVSEALNLYWPVDEDAAIQLVRNCRSEQPDATAEEIAFFVREKLELIRTNRSIANPTGLILATVPKSFVGQTFVAFRNRMQNQAQLAAEEEKRKRLEEEELRNWLQEQITICEEIVNDSTISQQERDVAEQRLRGFSTWNV
ncbi:hypothetical protein ACOBR2_20970 (plasmid) [Telmatobacter bradus]|uniref:hypothetical protein n=1 Tax=Telmatobacter bradus TaxID=474953 RepID=UPI003B431A98